MLSDADKIDSITKVVGLLCDHISKREGLSKKYELSFREQMLDEKDIINILAGNPPTVVISFPFVLSCFDFSSGLPLMSITNKAKLRDKLTRALEKVPKMQRTLSVVPLADAISLRQERKKFVKAAVERNNSSKWILQEKYLKYDISVTVTDTVTNKAVTITQDSKFIDIKKVTDAAKERLSNMLIPSEEYLELLEIMEFKPVNNPTTIQIDKEDKETIKYD